MSKEIVEKSTKQSLVKGKGMYSFQYTTKNPLMIVEDFKSKYAFEPERGQLMVYERDGILTPYITKSGWTRIANVKKISTKIQISKLTYSPKSAIVLCIAVLGDGTTHEFAGYSDETEPGRNTMSKIIAMATTRARNGALEAATNTQECSYEAFDESDEMKKRAIDVTELQEEKLSVCPKCKKRGWSKLQKHCTLCLTTYEQILQEKEGEK